MPELPDRPARSIRARRSASRKLSRDLLEPTMLHLDPRGTDVVDAVDVFILGERRRCWWCAPVFDFDLDATAAVDAA